MKKLFLKILSFFKYIKSRIKLITSLSLLIILAIFTLQNTETVNILFLLWKFELSRALLIFIVFLSGLLLGIILSSIFKRFRKKA